MKKIIISAFMIVLLSAAVFAAGGAEQAEETPDKLVYLTPSWGAPSPELLEDFEAETGIEVEVSTLGSADLRNKVMTAAAGRANPADIIFTGLGDFGNFGHSGILRPLDDLVPNTVFNQVAGRDLFQIDGNTFAVPLYQQTVLIDYDKAALESIGLTGEDIKTWDDFEAAALELKANGLEYPLAFGVRKWSYYLMALSQGSTLFDANGNPTFDNPADPGYDAFKQLIRYFELGLISPERLTSPNPHPSFWSGNAAFHQAWDGGLSIANDPERSEIAPNAAYLLQPNQHYTFGNGAGLGISAYTDYPQASLMFIEFMISDASQRYSYTTNGLFPGNTATADDLGNNNQIEGYDVLAEQAKYVVPLPHNTPWFPEFETELDAALLRVARGEVSSEKAIADLAEFQRNLKKEYE